VPLPVPVESSSTPRPDVVAIQTGVVLLALLAASSLPGCGSHTTFASRADLGGAAPVERLLVFADVGTMGFTDSMYEGFQTGMTSMLERCGVKSRVVALDFRTVAESRNLVASRELQPNAVLALRPAGGTITVTTLHGAEVSRHVSGLTYELRLFDLESEKVTWRARASVGLTSYGVSSGKDFATGIVSQLRTDGVLRGCRPGDFALPATGDSSRPHGPYGPQVR
jgi:hypothetical protein